MYIPNSFWTWSFFGVTLTQALITMGLEAYIFAKFHLSLIPAAQEQGGSEVRTIPTYLALIIFGFVYQLWLVYDALKNKNTIQIIGICAMNLAIMVYTAIQMDQIHDAFAALAGKRLIDPNYWKNVRPFLIALPCITGLGFVVMSFVAYKLYEEFAWTIYKQISADLRMKKRYLIYQIYIALLKFDFFLFLGFVIQFLVIVHNTTDAEFYLTVAALPIITLLLFLAAWSTKRENMIGMVISILVYFVALAYFIFKLIRMYTATSTRKSDYAPARRTLTVFAIITILFLLITICTACWCTRNFGHGLKVHISSKARQQRRQQHDEHGSYGLGGKMGDDVRYHYKDGGYARPGAGGSRMEID